jgi:O-antigen/teichoic acid export membrane protein
MEVAKILRAARIISWSTRLLSIAAGFVTVRLLIDRLGTAGYGEFAYGIATLTTIVGIDLGFAQALPRLVARLPLAEDQASARTFWATLAMCVAGLLILQVTLLGGACFLHASAPQVSQYGPWDLFATGLVMILATLLALSSALFAGFQMFGFSGVGKLLRPLLYVLAIIGLWWWHLATVRTALWASALTLFVANFVMFAQLIARNGSKMHWSWRDFPAAHRSQLVEMGSFSLRGWLFSLSTVMVTSGAVLAVGTLFAASDVAHLQIAIVIFMGVSASITGGLVPLTTIAAASDEREEAGRNRVAEAGRQLVGETAVLSAAAVIGILNFGGPVVALLLGAEGGDAQLVRDIYLLTLLICALGIGATPLFTFRYALVTAADNARYSTAVFVSSLLCLGAGVLAAALTHELLYIGLAIGMAMVYRCVQAWRMRPGVLRATRIWPVALFMLCLLLLFEAVALAIGQLDRAGVANSFVQMLIFGLFASMAYWQRTRLARMVARKMSVNS